MSFSSVLQSSHPDIINITILHQGSIPPEISSMAELIFFMRNQFPGMEPLYPCHEHIKGLSQVLSSYRRVFYSKRYILPLDHRARTVNASQSLRRRENPSWRKNPEEIVPQQKRRDGRRKTENTQHLHIFIMIILLICSNSQPSLQFITSIPIALQFFDGPFSAIFNVIHVLSQSSTYILFFSHFLSIML
jgi:hypothetical protein